MFVTFEGLDGSGKSTLARAVYYELSARGASVVLYNEPGSTPIGEKIRNLLMQEDMTEFTAAFLFNAARAELFYTKIQPYLRQRYTVLCDRYIDSTIAYQGYGHGLNLLFLEDLCHMATGYVKNRHAEPDLTFFLDLPVDDVIDRAKSDNKRDNLNRSFLEHVRNGYLLIGKRNSHRWRTIDATQPREQIVSQVVTEILDNLDKAI